MSKKTKGAVKKGASGKKGPMMDGFRTLLEPAYISVKEENIAPFSMPIEAFTFKPQDDMIVSHFKNGDKERKIYCNIEPSEEEKDSILKLQEEAKAQGLEFLPSIVIMAGRFLSRARGDPHKAIKLMMATQEWKLDFFKEGPVSDTSVADSFKHGVVYFCGRDYGMRPTIVCRASRIPAEWYKDKKLGTEKLIRALIFCMEYMVRYMCVPGKIENNCLIVDLKGLGMSGVPISVLSQIYSVMSHHYIGRVFRFYVVNMSSGLSTIAGWVKNILTDRQKQKLALLDNLNDLKADFAPGQLEEDLGGTRPVIKTFFPFPLEGGPYEKGATSSIKQKPSEGAHKVLSDSGWRGRIYDSKLSAEENADLDYVLPDAVEFFEREGVKLPPDLEKQYEAWKKTEEARKAAEAEKEVGIANKDTQEGNSESSPNAPAALQEELEEEEDEDEDEDILIQDSQVVKSGGLFSCSPCWCNQPR